MRALFVLLLVSFLVFPKEIIGQTFCGTASDEPPGCLLNSTIYADQLAPYSTSSLASSITGTF